MSTHPSTTITFPRQTSREQGVEVDNDESSDVSTLSGSEGNAETKDDGNKVAEAEAEAEVEMNVEVEVNNNEALNNSSLADNNNSGDNGIGVGGADMAKAKQKTDMSTPPKPSTARRPSPLNSRSNTLRSRMKNVNSRSSSKPRFQSYLGGTKKFINVGSAHKITTSPPKRKVPRAIQIQQDNTIANNRRSSGYQAGVNFSDKISTLRVESRRLENRMEGSPTCEKWEVQADGTMECVLEDESSSNQPRPRLCNKNIGLHNKGIRSRSRSQSQSSKTAMATATAPGVRRRPSLEAPNYRDYERNSATGIRTNLSESTGVCSHSQSHCYASSSPSRLSSSGIRKQRQERLRRKRFSNANNASEAGSSLGISSHGRSSHGLSSQGTRIITNVVGIGSGRNSLLERNRKVGPHEQYQQQHQQLQQRQDHKTEQPKSEASASSRFQELIASMGLLGPKEEKPKRRKSKSRSRSRSKDNQHLVNMVIDTGVKIQKEGVKSTREREDSTIHKRRTETIKQLSPPKKIKEVVMGSLSPGTEDVVTPDRSIRSVRSHPPPPPPTPPPLSSRKAVYMQLLREHETGPSGSAALSDERPMTLPREKSASPFKAGTMTPESLDSPTTPRLYPSKGDSRPYSKTVSSFSPIKHADLETPKCNDRKYFSSHSTPEKEDHVKTPVVTPKPIRPVSLHRSFWSAPAPSDKAVAATYYNNYPSPSHTLSTAASSITLLTATPTRPPFNELEIKRKKVLGIHTTGGEALSRSSSMNRSPVKVPRFVPTKRTFRNSSELEDLRMQVLGLKKTAACSAIQSPCKLSKDSDFSSITNSRQKPTKIPLIRSKSKPKGEFMSRVNTDTGTSKKIPLDELYQSIMTKYELKPDLSEDEKGRSNHNRVPKGILKNATFDPPALERVMCDDEKSESQVDEASQTCDSTWSSFITNNTNKDVEEDASSREDSSEARDSWCQTGYTKKNNAIKSSQSVLSVDNTVITTPSVAYQHALTKLRRSDRRSTIGRIDEGKSVTSDDNSVTPSGVYQKAFNAMGHNDGRSIVGTQTSSVTEGGKSIISDATSLTPWKVYRKAYDTMGHNDGLSIVGTQTSSVAEGGKSIISDATSLTPSKAYQHAFNQITHDSSVGETFASSVAGGDRSAFSDGVSQTPSAAYNKAFQTITQDSSVVGTFASTVAGDERSAFSDGVSHTPSLLPNTFNTAFDGDVSGGGKSIVSEGHSMTPSSLYQNAFNELDFEGSIVGTHASSVTGGGKSIASSTNYSDLTSSAPFTLFEPSVSSVYEEDEKAEDDIDQLIYGAQESPKDKVFGDFDEISNDFRMKAVLESDSRNTPTLKTLSESASEGGSTNSVDSGPVLSEKAKKSKKKNLKKHSNTSNAALLTTCVTGLAGKDSGCIQSLASGGDTLSDQYSRDSYNSRNMKPKRKWIPKRISSRSRSRSKTPIISDSTPILLGKIRTATRRVLRRSSKPRKSNHEQLLEDGERHSETGSSFKADQQEMLWFNDRVKILEKKYSYSRR